MCLVPMVCCLIVARYVVQRSVSKNDGSVVTGCGMLPVEFADEAGTKQDGDCCSGVNYASAGTVVRVWDFSFPSLS